MSSQITDNLEPIKPHPDFDYTNAENIVVWSNGVTPLSQENLNKTSDILKYLLLNLQHRESGEDVPYESLLGQIIDRIDNLVAHNNNKNNPHNVLASQVAYDNDSNVEDTLDYLVADIHSINSKIGEGFGSENTISSKTTELTTEIDEHKNNTENPHNVTASQVTFSNIDYTDVQSVIDAILSNYNSVTNTLYTLTNDVTDNSSKIGDGFSSENTISEKTTTLTNEIDNHKNNQDNPHKVTKAQVGLGNVENKSIDEIKETLKGRIEDNSEAFVMSFDVKLYLDSLFMRVDEQAEKDATIESSINQHYFNSENPHKVTKTQVGLGNVDNMSVAAIKNSFTGKIENNNQGFVLGGDVYELKSDIDELSERVTSVENATNPEKAITTEDEVIISCGSSTD